MDILDQDSGLAQNVIQLLNQELLAVRRQLQEAQRSKSALKDGSLSQEKQEEIEALTAENNALRAANVAKEKEIEELRTRCLETNQRFLEPKFELQEVSLDSSFARPDGERDDDTIAQLQQKLDNRKLKYKELKASAKAEIYAIKSQYEEMETAHETVRSEIDGLHRRIDEAHLALKDAQASVMQVKNEPKTLVARCRAFLTTIVKPTTPWDPSMDFGPPCPKQTWTMLQNSQTCVGFKTPEIYFGDGWYRAMTAAATHCFYPKNAGGKGSWAVNDIGRGNEGETRQMFYSESQAQSQPVLRYLGVYKCFFKEAIHMNVIKPLVGASTLESIYASTIRQKKLVPPFMADAVESMYSSGALKVHCIGWEYVSFDRAFYDSLLAAAPKKKPAVPKASKKRSQEESSDQPPPPSKRQKNPKADA